MRTSSEIILEIVTKSLLTVLLILQLTNDSRLQIDKDRPGDVLAGAGLREECVEGVVAAADGLVGGHLAVGLDAVLQAVELPAGVAHLATGLAHMDGDALTLQGEKGKVLEKARTIH